METQIELTKTAVELARLDHRANITKAENLRRPEREGSVRISIVVLLQCKKENQVAVRHPLLTKTLSTLIKFKLTAV